MLSAWETTQIHLDIEQDKQINMKYYNQLTKETFWNDVEKLNPQKFQEFKDWIDKYKEKVGWDDLFQFAGGTAPKYHDLPIAFQIGIFLEYVQDTDRSRVLQVMPEAIRNHFKTKI